ncbi:MAG: hypothetical protein LC734_08605 [Acidobacteria bacterium]|nr:hypothetical protein [Acidobacteriota bacterium]
MNRMFALQNYTAIEPDIRRIAETPGLLRATPLGGADKSETLDFLAILGFNLRTVLDSSIFLVHPPHPL